VGRLGILCLPWIAAALALALVAAWLSSGSRDAELPRASLSVASALSAGAESDYARAEAPHEFQFPRDHAAHDGFKTEWWYFTGNLETPAGGRFGYQLTFFRVALTPHPAPRASTFAADHVWMAHFALSDIVEGQFKSFERFARESAGVAGAATGPVRVWLRDWRCEFSSGGTPIRLVARADGIAIDLRLDGGKPPVLHGDGGLSRKHAGAGNASYYASLTRLETSGRVELDGTALDVHGLSWMDREWMTTGLDAEQSGWEWFGLQLDDGTELMWYRFRRRDGSADPFDGGSFVAVDGTRTALASSELALAEDSSWTSPRSKAVYPAHWRLRCEKLGLDIEVSPALADQELDASFRYWEGAVDVVGTRANREVHGRGYVELVGYAATNSAAMLR
jgi:predicted secreted hydrolase